MTRTKRCPHGAAWPTIRIYGRGYGQMWCPDCGAIRRLINVGAVGIAYAFGSRWIYPRGIEDVTRQLERERKSMEESL